MMKSKEIANKRTEKNRINMNIEAMNETKIKKSVFLYWVAGSPVGVAASDGPPDRGRFYCAPGERCGEFGKTPKSFHKGGYSLKNRSKSLKIV